MLGVVRNVLKDARDALRESGVGVADRDML